MGTICRCVNKSRPGQNGQHLADNIFKRIFFNEKVRILINISLKFVPKDPINNNSALVQIIAWRHTGDKPSFEPASNVLLKFGLDIKSQTEVRVRKPKNPRWPPGGHFESDIAENQ